MGSNIGDRSGYLNRAAARLRQLEDLSVVWFSPVYESDPVGNEDQPPFLNAVGEIDTGLTPPDLLARLKAIELDLGRTPSDRWGPREIDLDILLYDGLVYDQDGVQVPHPRLEERRFALVPFRDIAPDVVHPISGVTIEELARGCRESCRMKLSSHKILE
jgi:2-amino-4-hydroxy-6-hydroxymethyldihydropteridine diphosphokinase